MVQGERELLLQRSSSFVKMEKSISEDSMDMDLMTKAPPRPKPRPSQVPSAYPTPSKTIMDMDVALASSLMHM